MNCGTKMKSNSRIWLKFDTDLFLHFLCVRKFAVLDCQSLVKLCGNAEIFSMQIFYSLRIYK